jgi:hypothetical protein
MSIIARIARAAFVALLSVTPLTVVDAAPPQERTPDGRAHNPGLPGWCETPAADRKAEEGCYTTAIADVGRLPATAIYWHLDVFPSRTAAEAARAARSTVVDSQHRHWLFTIAEAGWRPSGGERVATIGPLVIDPAVPYTARYQEAVIAAGFQDGIGKGHWHPGPEAWYVLEGGQCLETPAGVTLARKGDTMLAPEGAPMAIASLGTETRRTLLLVLHRSSHPYVMREAMTADAPHAHWEPKGSCPR